jgi:amino acid adenylation domain-containing protein
VLSSIIANPDQTIKDLDPLSTYDTTQIQNWRYPIPEGDQRCLHEAFTAQALARPKDIAISSWDGELTYAELEDLSNRLGYYLTTSKGIKPEVVVPLCFDKSIWSVVSMLAVLKAGGACVNLDVSHPLSRMQNIIQEVGAHIMLAGPTHHTKFNACIDTIIVIDKAFVYSLATYTGPISSAVKSNNLSFVVFTSGSSGKPKGIMLEHKTVHFSCRGYKEVLDVNPDSRLFQFSAYAFDVHITEIFMPLIYGACLCLPSEFERKDKLGDTIHRLKATHIFLTPTVATVLEPKEVPTLRKMLLGGEALSKENLLVWADKLDLFSVYGPSETSNWVSSHRMITAAEQPANLGRGVDIDSWIIDPENSERLVPVGCVGELCVAGPSLSRGYINDPVKTEEAFGFSPPWAIGANGVKHNRVYRTGDLVRYNSDGTYNYMGRLDTQIKIRGQRLELAEVEHHLVDAAGVRSGCSSKIWPMRWPTCGYYDTSPICQYRNSKTSASYIFGVQRRNFKGDLISV